MEKNKIQPGDIYALVGIKMKNPDMELEDLYRKIDEIQPSTPKCYYVYVVFIWLILLGAMLAALFLRECDVWMRIVYITYILFSSIYYYVLRKYKQIIWPHAFLVMVVAYIVLSPTITITAIVDILKSLIGVA